MLLRGIPLRRWSGRLVLSYGNTFLLLVGVVVESDRKVKMLQIGERPTERDLLLQQVWKSQEFLCQQCGCPGGDGMQDCWWYIRCGSCD